MPELDMLLAGLDADSNLRGRQFERICKWYLSHDPAYRRTLRRVWLWDEWPGRKGPDTGIDLVAEDQQGHLWAIQAKAYSPDHTVTKRDIDTFLSASSAQFGCSHVRVGPALDLGVGLAVTRCESGHWAPPGPHR